MSNLIRDLTRAQAENLLYTKQRDDGGWDVVIDPIEADDMRAAQSDTRFVGEGEHLGGEPMPTGKVPDEPPVIYGLPGATGSRHPNQDKVDRLVGKHPALGAGYQEEQHLPYDRQARKDVPLYSGLLAYFPDALAEVARLSKAGNDQHNPGQPLHWSREKSNDHLDCIARHLLDVGKVSDDGFLHDVMLAWRALANLQLALERQRSLRPTTGAR